MPREEVTPPQELADAHTLIAQRYAGALVGHPYQDGQQNRIVVVDQSRPWREPAVVADDCLFCVRLTDEEAVRLASSEETHALFQDTARAGDNLPAVPEKS